VSRQIEIIVFGKTRSQIKSVQHVAVGIGVIFPRNVDAFVAIQFAHWHSGKERVVCAHADSRIEIRLYGFQSVLLLSVQVQRNFRQIKMSEIERIMRCVSAKGAIVDQSDDYASGQLTGKQLLARASQ